MACASCGFENRASVRFCVECGAPLAVRCPVCQADAQPGQKFCGECGTALTGAPAPAAVPTLAPSAVRKTVTVLFADLGGSTGFGERTDAEVSRQVLAEYHALLQAVIDAHAGTVAKFMGDGMMATFGIPEVAEDDARRAVDAGAAMQRRFHEFAAEVERRHGETLTLRVGINTGEVVIGAGDADLIGDALNVAARLEKACRPGHVLVGEETWRLTRGAVGYEELGEVTVAGRAQPVAIYELALESDATPDVATPFVGRDVEMQRLVGVFDDARRTSNARLVTVLGSPGVGKTRLSRELCSHLADQADAQRVELRCDRAGEATFAPIAQLLRDAAGLGEDTDADAARAAIGTLLTETEADHARVVDVLAALVGAAPARSVEETFWGVRRLIEATAALRPLVVVIDDIQWAEPLLLDLIEHLAEWVADAAVLLVGLARPELREVRPSLAEPGRPVAAVVVLDGLDASATEALAAGLLGTDRLPAGLVERLPASTDGNPLFVRELVRMLVDDRVVRRRDDGEWELTIDAEAVDVPPTIQSLLGARVERLPAAERDLLEHASVVGAEFSLGALRELAGARAPIVPMLETMRRKELVEPTGTYWGDEPVYRFHHVLIRDAAYRRLLKTTRAELHERVAAWTDRTAADLIGEHETAIAFHYEQAYRYRGELGALDDHGAELGRRAAELLTTAAQRALGRDDLAAAGASSARALALLPESDAATRADLLMMGCECLLATGDGAAARPLVEELVHTAAADPRLAAWGECYAAQLVGLTDPEGLVSADAQAQAAAEALTELGDGSGQAKAHQVRAGLLARLGRVGDAELELDLALAAARAAADRRRVTAVLGSAPDAALFGPSPVARAGGRCLDVVRLLRITTASPSVEAASNRCQAVLESLRGRFDVSRSMLASARASLEELGLRHGLAQTELYAGMVELIAGDPHAAIAPLRAAFSGLGALGVGADAGNAAALLARALLVDGAIDEADEMATASEQLAGQNLKTAIGWRVARAEVLAARGDVAVGISLAEQAVEIAAGTDLVIDHADACVVLATLRASAGDAAGARAVRADAKRLYEQKGATIPAARLDEEHAQPAPASSIAPPPRPTAVGVPVRVENTATRVWACVQEVINAGADRELADLIAPGYRFDDRYPVVNFGEVDRAGSGENLMYFREQGWELEAAGAIAVRGERLALSRSGSRSAAGDETKALVVVEVDEQGRLQRTTRFGDNDLAAAIEELDARYIVGEGAAHADLVRSVSAWLRALEGHDENAMRNLAAPDFVFVERRLIGWPPLDIDGLIEMQRTYADVRYSFIARTLDLSERATLATCVNQALDATGGEVQWVFHSVGVVDVDGRGERMETFAEDDWDAALARFEELSAASREGSRPTPENAASRGYAHVMAVVASGADRELADLIAREFRWDDRRRVVNYGVADPADAAAQVSWLREAGFDISTPRGVSVRGERLALCWNDTRTPSGDEISSLTVIESDEHGRLLGLVQFDEDALAAAIEELEARYVAGEGAEHAEPVIANASWLLALNTHDYDALRDLAAPDIAIVDHRQIGLPSLDVEGFIEWYRGYSEFRFSYVTTNLRARGRVILATVVNDGVDPDGGEVVWTFHSICLADDVGRHEGIEIFAEEDWDSALARFEELSVVDARHRRIENAATVLSDRFVALTRARRFDAAARLLRADLERIDHRSHLAYPPIHSAADYMAWHESVYEQFDSITADPIAIRGERLGLSRTVLAADGGFASVLLMLGELDDQGLLASLALYDEDDLDAAVAELDARYAAREGAEHAAEVTLVSAWMRALGRLDFEAIRRLTAPSLVYVDHRPLVGWGTVGLDEMVELFRSLADLQWGLLVSDLHVLHHCSLVTAANRAIDANGGEVVWLFHVVGTSDGSGRASRVEVFDEDDRDAALARFDELAAETDDPRHSRAENAATRAGVEILRLVAENRLDDAEQYFAEGYRRTDRRSGLSAPDADGGRAYLEAWRGFYDVGFDAVDNEYLAVRGERLCLVRCAVRTDDGREIVFLQVAEFDESGRAIIGVNFDEDDLVAALAELDARCRAAGVASEAEIATLDNFAAINRRDWDTFGALGSPDLVVLDHQPLGFPPTGWDEFVTERMPGLVAMVPDVVIMPVKVLASGDTTLTVISAAGTTSDGSRWEWAPLAVGRLGADGRVAVLEFFLAEQWDAAIACFDELVAVANDPVAALAPSIGNTATGRLAELMARTNAGDTEAIESLVAPTFEALDRRSVTAGPTTTGDSFLAGAAQVVEVFDEVVADEVLATRGERLSLTRNRFVSANGFDVRFIGLGEIDEGGRVLATVMFDDDDLVDALQELEDRYVAGEGAADASTVRRAGDLVRSMLHLDGAATLGLCDPAIRLTDYRRIGFGTIGFDGVQGILAARAEQISQDTSYFRTLMVRGDTAIGWWDQREVSDGSEYDDQLFWITEFVAGRMRYIDWYELEDHEAASARFAELAGADPRTPVLDNDAVRTMTRLEWTARFEFDRSVEMFSPDAMYTDRRGVVALPTLTGHDGMGAMYTSIFDVYDDMVIEPVAVRGERAALFAIRFSTADGFESTGYLLGCLDDQHRFDTLEFYDEADLGTALDLLDARHAELMGDALPPIERNSAAGVKALRERDFDAFAATLEPGFTFEDRSPLGFGRLDRATYIESQRQLAEMVTGAVPFAAKYCATDRAAITTFPTTALNADGPEFALRVVYVGRVGGTGLASEVVGFDVEQWDAALALFDEWSKAEEPASLTLRPMENAATRNLASGGNVEVLAVRGQSLAVTRTVTSDAGDVVRLAVNEIDADGRSVRTEVFEAGDLARAITVLDTWYLEGEGADLAWMIRPSIAFWRCHNARDWGGIRRIIADEVELVDHRLASAGTSIQTADQFVTYAQRMIELVPDLVAYEAEYLAMGRAWALTRQVAHGTSEAGAEIELPGLILADSRDGRFTHTETFAPEQLAEALARFEELEAAEPPARTTTLSNRATRSQDVYSAAFDARDWDATAASCADDIFNDDRRTGVSSGVTVGREALLELARALADVGFTSVTTIPIAIRGEGLALMRRTWHQVDGFELVLLAVVEVDADGVMTANVMFDAEDLTGAVYELDQRYFAGEGAEHAWFVHPAAEFWRGYNARDWDSARALLAGDVAFVDHGPIGAGTTVQTADQLITFLQGLVDLVPDVVAFDAEFLAFGRRRALIRHVARGTSTQGADVQMDNPVIITMTDGRFSRIEGFAMDQLAEAWTRFEELEADAEPSA